MKLVKDKSWNPWQLVSFYGSLTKGRRAVCVCLVMLGFFLRSSSVVIFALTVKAFLIVLDPTATVAVLNRLLNLQSSPISNIQQLVEYVVGGLTAMVLLQYALNRMYLSCFIAIRRRVVLTVIRNPVSSNSDYQKHVCLALIPEGFESLIKITEIAIFYSCLVLLIFLISPLIGIVVIALLVLILGFMLIFVSEKADERRQAFLRRQDASDGEKMIQGLDFADHTFRSIRNNSIYSEFFGGLGMVMIMLLYTVWAGGSIEIKNGLVALVLVLSIRFLINYTGEFSRLARILLNQFDMFEKFDLQNSGFSRKTELELKP